MASTSILNLASDTAKNIIGNESTPLLEIVNSGTGPGLKVNNFVVTSTATVSGMVVASPIQTAAATIVPVLVRGASVASGSVIGFLADALVSCTTIKFTTGGVNGTKAIRIVQNDGTFAWIPVLPDAAVTGASI